MNKIHKFGICVVLGSFFFCFVVFRIHTNVCTFDPHCTFLLLHLFCAKVTIFVRRFFPRLLRELGCAAEKVAGRPLSPLAKIFLFEAKIIIGFPLIKC